MFKLGGTDPEKSYRATLNNDDGDSNENGKKQKRTDQKNNFQLALASRLRKETAQFHVLWRGEHKTTTLFFD